MSLSGTQRARSGEPCAISSNLERLVERRTGDERRIRSDLRVASRDRGLAVYLAAFTVVVATLLVGSGPPWAQWVSATLAFAVAVFFAATRRLAVRAVPFALPAERTWSRG